MIYGKHGDCDGSEITAGKTSLSPTSVAAITVRRAEPPGDDADSDAVGGAYTSAAAAAGHTKQLGTRRRHRSPTFLADTLGNYIFSPSESLARAAPPFRRRRGRFDLVVVIICRCCYKPFARASLVDNTFIISGFRGVSKDGIRGTEDAEIRALNAYCASIIIIIINISLVIDTGTNNYALLLLR